MKEVERIMQSGVYVSKLLSIKYIVFLTVELAMIMDRLYGGVCYAGIDTDPELKYPKGAGRVAFSNQQSYIAAISARFVQLQHGEIDKRVSADFHKKYTCTLPFHEMALIQQASKTLKKKSFGPLTLVVTLQHVFGWWTNARFV